MFKRTIIASAVLLATSTAWAAWSAFGPVLDMTRELGQPAPSFLKFLWDVLTASPFDDSGSLAIGVAAAVANAIYHATGKRVRDLPITLDKLL